MLRRRKSGNESCPSQIDRRRELVLAPPGSRHAEPGAYSALPAPPAAPMLNRRPQGLTTFRVLFWTCIALGLLLLIADRWPLRFGADNPGARPDFVFNDKDADVIVVIDASELRRRTANGDFARAWAWVDALEQEYGPTAVRTHDEIDSSLLADTRLLILSESAARGELWAERISLLESWVNGGGILALELPTGALRANFAADGAGGWRSPGAITAINGADETMESELLAMPLLTRYLGSVQPLAGAQTLMAMDGAPVIYSKLAGRGQVLVFDFAVAAQLSALQQGLPGQRMRVRPRQTGEPVRSADLAASPAMFGSVTPYADVLERFVVHAALGSTYPLVFLWPWPEGAHGAILSSHRSRYVSGRPLWMSVHERSRDARTPTFVAAPDPSGDTRSMDAEEHSAHAALLWVLDPESAGLRKSWGIFGLEPIVQSLQLEAQLQHMVAAFDGLSTTDVHGIRVYDGRWSEDYVGIYRTLQALGFRYDVTYGPAEGTPQGFLFGTCQPFRPVDTSGAPFSLFEVPVCFVDPSTQSELQLLGEAIRRATEQSDLVHVLTSSDSFRDQPELEAFDAWRDMLRFAAQNDMWIGGAGQLIDFRQRRADATFRVVATTVEERDEENRPRRYQLVLEADVPGSGFHAALPAAVGGLILREVNVGAALEQEDEPDEDEIEAMMRTYGGRQVRLVELSPGFSTVTIHYDTP